MPEEKNAGVPPEVKPEPAPQETELLAELARVRSRGKLFKTIAISLSVVVIIFLVIVFFSYRQIMVAKAILDGVEQGFRPLGEKPSAGAGYADAPELVRATPAGGSPGQYVSGLGLLSMPDSGAAQEEGGELQAPATGEMDQKLGLAMLKYAKRPLVREFMAELAKDPDYARLQAKNKSGNPLVVIAGMQKSPVMRKLLMKYAVRPDFIKLMTEVMQDPEIKPLLKQARGGGSAMPGPLAPAPARATAAQAALQPAEEEGSGPDGEGEITFNASAVSGPAKPAASSAGKPPPPVDNGR